MNFYFNEVRCKAGRIAFEDQSKFRVVFPCLPQLSYTPYQQIVRAALLRCLALSNRKSIVLAHLYFSYFSLHFYFQSVSPYMRASMAARYLSRSSGLNSLIFHTQMQQWIQKQNTVKQFKTASLNINPTRKKVSVLVFFY